MTVLPIRLFGDPVLRTRAAEVTRFDDDLRRLVADMVDTMRDAPGVGLAAPQVGVGLRVFTFEVDGRLGHVVNPELTLSGEPEAGEEGCLSIPGIYADVTRPTHVELTGRTADGEPLAFSADGLFARCVQHETDHLDGVLFLDRLDKPARREAMRAVRQAPWSGMAQPASTAPATGAFGGAFGRGA